MADRPLRPATHRSLGGPLPRQLANGPRAHPRPEAEATFGTSPVRPAHHQALASVSTGYSCVLGRLPTCYSPVRRSSTPEGAFPLDLHVLSTPPAFVLSQDQTLQQKPLKNIPAKKLLPKESTSIHRCRQEPNNWHWHHKHPVEFSKNNPTRGNSPTLPGDPHRVKPFCRLSSVCTDRTRQCPP